MAAEHYKTVEEEVERSLLASLPRVTDFNSTLQGVVRDEADALDGDNYQVSQDDVDRKIGRVGVWETRFRRTRKGVSVINRVGYFVVSASIGTIMTLGFWLATNDLFVLSGGLAISVVFPLGVALGFDGGFRRWALRLKVYGNR